MAVTVGSAEIGVHFDGRGNAMEARALGEEAGAEAGGGFSTGWKKKLGDFGKKISADFRKQGKDSGDAFNKGFAKMWDKKTNVALDDFSGALKRNRVQVENHGASLKHWQAITLAVTALILGAGDDIAALGSALGAGITVLAAGATSLAIAGGVVVAAFKGLSGEIDSLPASVRPAAQGLADLKASFKDLQTAITVATFKNSQKAFQSLRDTVRGLTPAFEAVGESVGRVFDQLAAGIAPGTDGFKTLNKLVKQSGPIFERIAGIVGKLADALGSAFTSPAMLKSINKLLDYIDRLGTAFQKFTKGNGLDQWLAHADSVFGALGRLLGQVGTTLNGLVTDRTVQQLTNFLDQITSIVPFLGQLIDLGGKLDPLDLIGKALQQIADIAQPLIGPLGNLATALHDVASIMIDEWGQALGDISKALAPVIQDLADFLGGLDEQTIRNVADAMLAFAAAALIIKGANGIAGLATKITALGTSFDVLKKKGKGLKGAAGGIAGAIAGITTAFAGGGPGGSAASGALTGATVGGLPGFLIGALAGAITSMFTDWPTWMNGLQQISDFFTTWWTNITGGAVTNGWDQIVAGFANGWQQILAGFANGATQIATWWTGLMASFANGYLQITTWWNGMWTTIFTSTGTWLASIIGSVISWLAGLMANFISWGAGVIGWWNGLWSSLWSFIITIWNNIMRWIASSTANIVNGLHNAFNGIGAWWNGLWGGIGSFFASVWDGILNAGRSAINTLSGILNGIIGPINDVLSAIRNLTGGLVNLHIPSLPSLPKTAIGGVFNGAQARIIGEAGAEAVVPLNRDLSRVDPSVRALSAFAQGKLGSNGGPQKVITVEKGAVQVTYTGVDPELVGTSAMDRLIARMA